MLRALFGAILGGTSGWAVVMIALGYHLTTIRMEDLNFVCTVAIGCGAVAGSVLGATSALTDEIRARTATLQDRPRHGQA